MHHTKECKLGTIRTVKLFASRPRIVRGWVIWLEHYIAEQVYKEKWNHIFSTDECQYEWKTQRVWTVKQFEEKHGPFEENFRENHPEENEIHRFI